MIARKSAHCIYRLPTPGAARTKHFGRSSPLRNPLQRATIALFDAASVRAGEERFSFFVTNALCRSSNEVSSKEVNLQLQQPRRSGAARVVDLLEPRVSFQHPRPRTRPVQSMHARGWD